VKNPNYSLKKVQEIVSIKAKWIYTKVTNLTHKLSIHEIYENEGKVLYLGSKETIQIKNLEDFYRKTTKDMVLRELKDISQKMLLNPTKISFRKTKNRWGSCNHKNELSFAITLSQLPIEGIRYIITHELAHILHKNHQRQFYSTIKKFMPNYKSQELIIKNYSPSLFF